MKVVVVFLLVAVVQENLAVPKIINGELAKEGEFPHMVQLSIKRKDSTKYCGGSLITDQWVLTAAHCIKEMISAKAFLGSVFMRTMKVKSKIIDASIHPLYVNVNEHDIALVKLESPVTFTERIQPVKLPARHQTPTEIFIDDTLLVPGFGETKNGSQSSLFLRFVKMQAISNEDCSDEWYWKIRETLVCAEGINSFNSTTCNGDSGNGLIRKDVKESIVFGIVSYGAPGCVGKPKVFTRVASYLDYIKDVTGIEIKE